MLVDEAVGKDPLASAVDFDQENLGLVFNALDIELFGSYGRLEHYEFPDLRFVLFAGEVFPIKHLRMLKRPPSQAQVFEFIRTNRDQRLHLF